MTTCPPSIRSIWPSTTVPKPSPNPLREPSRANSRTAEEERARVRSVLPPNPTLHIPVSQPPPTSPSHTRIRGTYLLWGVTFCSILTTGNRRCPQPREVRVASVPLTSRSSITREVGEGWRAVALGPPGDNPHPPRPAGTKAVFSASSQQLGALRRRRTARKWRRPQQRRANEGGRTPQTLGQPPIPDTVVNTARC